MSVTDPRAISGWVAVYLRPLVGMNPDWADAALRRLIAHVPADDPLPIPLNGTMMLARCCPYPARRNSTTYRRGEVELLFAHDAFALMAFERPFGGRGDLLVQPDARGDDEP
jgi:hypothetical protein